MTAAASVAAALVLVSGALAALRLVRATSRG